MIIYTLIFYLSLERGEKREWNISVWEKHGSVASPKTPGACLALNGGMWPDWDSHQQPFGLQAGAQSTGPHQPGLISLFLRGEVIVYSLKVNLKHSLFSKRFFIFRERGREGEREGNVHVWLPLKHPLLGTWPTTQACALTRNRTSNPLVCSPHSIHWVTAVRAGTDFLIDTLFRAVLGSQQNWVGSTELPCALCPPCVQLPHCQHPTPEWCICCDQWTCTDTSSSPRVQSLH